MGLHRITKGLDLPIAGEPEQAIAGTFRPKRVAVLGRDYAGMRPTMQVDEGDTVRRGQLLFEDKKTPGVRYTAPGAGTVAGIYRGERRAFVSLVIDLNESEQTGTVGDDDHVTFDSHTGKSAEALTGEELKALLLESGLWTALRGRPYGRVANPETTPRAIFVTAMDSNPLAPSCEAILKGREKDFHAGLRAVAKLTDGPTYLCTAPGTSLSAPAGSNVQVEQFTGPHPAGTVGVHIHTLAPVCRDKVVWYLGFQDVIAIGRLIATGKLDVERVVAVGGPTVTKPRLIATRLGASLDELLAGELEDCENRVISGSVLSGHRAMGDQAGYLGRYHQQVSVLREGREREFMSWVMPGMDKFSVIPTYLAGLLGKNRSQKWRFTTTKNGSDRAIVPIGMYERVMPMDIQPTYLLRSLVVKDVERAEQLGALELEEEDLGLCTFVCPGKADYGLMLRENLTILEKEG